MRLKRQEEWGFIKQQARRAPPLHAAMGGLPGQPFQRFKKGARPTPCLR
jgi:hypothetical protein